MEVFLFSNLETADPAVQDFFDLKRKIPDKGDLTGTDSGPFPGVSPHLAQAAAVGARVGAPDPGCGTCPSRAQAGEPAPRPASATHPHSREEVRGPENPEATPPLDTLFGSFVLGGFPFLF